MVDAIFSLATRLHCPACVVGSWHSHVFNELHAPRITAWKAGVLRKAQRSGKQCVIMLTRIRNSQSMVKHTKNSSDSIKCTSPRHSQDKGWNFMDALSWWCLSSFFLSTYLTIPLSMLPPSLYQHQKKKKYVALLQNRYNNRKVVQVRTNPAQTVVGFNSDQFPSHQLREG